MKLDGVQTTIIGSLPCRNASEALDLLERYPLSLPTWPQLPKRSFREGMVVQYTEGFPGIRVDEAERRVWIERTEDLPDLYASFFEHALSGDPGYFSISEGYSAGLAAFVQRRSAVPDRLPALKGHVTGPFTMGLSVMDSKGSSAWFDPEYRQVIVTGLVKKALWQAAALRPFADDILVFFDEPIFAALGTPAYLGIGDDQVSDTYGEICHELQAAGIAVGIHCCGNMDWGLLSRCPVDLISFDAYSFGEKVALYAPDIAAFLDRGGYLAWGLVPTGNRELLDKEDASSLRKRQEDLATLFERKGVPRDRLRRQMVVTPSCGMGTLPVSAAERALDLLHQFRSIG